MRNTRWGTLQEFLQDLNTGHRAEATAYVECNAGYYSDGAWISLRLCVIKANARNKPVLPG